MVQSEIEQAIQTEGPVLREKLLRTNPLLTPDGLSEIIPAYKDWMPFRRSYRLWSTSQGFFRILSNSFQYVYVLAKISGVSAVGKDALREEMMKLAPGFLRRVVTATSRPPKIGEIEGVDYYFYQDRDRMIRERAEFIEQVLQGDRVYGLPKKSLVDAMTAEVPFLVTHVEMGSGWSAIGKYFTHEYSGSPPFELHVFMLPEMDMRTYEEWLRAHRPANEVQYRAVRAAWEIYQAPKRADFIITNVMRLDRPTLSYEAAGLIDQMCLLLKDDIPRPRGSLKLPDLGVGYLDDVPKAQDAILPH